MANALMAKGKGHILADWLSGKTLKVVCVDSADYTFSASHEFLSDIPSGGRVATSPALTGVTTTNGVLDCDDSTIAGVTGDQFEEMFLYVDTGSAATSTLIVHWDTATGLPLTPSGGDVIFTPHASGLFSL